MTEAKGPRTSQTPVSLAPRRFCVWGVYRRVLHPGEMGRCPSFMDVFTLSVTPPSPVVHTGPRQAVSRQTVQSAIDP